MLLQTGERYRYTLCVRPADAKSHAEPDAEPDAKSHAEPHAEPHACAVHSFPVEQHRNVHPPDDLPVPRSIYHNTRV